MLMCFIVAIFSAEWHPEASWHRIMICLHESRAQVKYVNLLRCIIENKGLVLCFCSWNYDGLVWSNFVRCINCYLYIVPCYGLYMKVTKDMNSSWKCHFLVFVMFGQHTCHKCCPGSMILLVWNWSCRELFSLQMLANKSRNLYILAVLGLGKWGARGDQFVLNKPKHLYFCNAQVGRLITTIHVNCCIRTSRAFTSGLDHWFEILWLDQCMTDYYGFTMSNLNGDFLSKK
jgi:hypothetical protein